MTKVNSFQLMRTFMVEVRFTGADDGVIAVGEGSLCPYCQDHMPLYQSAVLVVSGSDDCTVILRDLSGLDFVKHFLEFPAPVSAVHVNDLTGEIVTAAGVLLAVWIVNGDCFTAVNTSQLASDLILSVTTPMLSDWLETNWYITGHQSGGVKVWNMIHSTAEEGSGRSKSSANIASGLGLTCRAPVYKLVLQKVLKSHKHPVTALHVTSDLKLLLSGDSGGLLFVWTLPEESQRASFHGW